MPQSAELQLCTMLHSDEFRLRAMPHGKLSFQKDLSATLRYSHSGELTPLYAT
jgi:hypothetical protein